MGQRHVLRYISILLGSDSLFSRREAPERRLNSLDSTMTEHKLLHGHLKFSTSDRALYGPASSGEIFPLARDMHLVDKSATSSLGHSNVPSSLGHRG